ncbi:MAG: VOC family protein [Thermoleophilaceae bacterium]
MGERSSYTPGTFCWVDLSTTDQDAAKSFYSGLFGWEANDVPVGDEATYSMMHSRGKIVGAIAGQPPAQRDAGVPPAWNHYVSVESADAAAERAAELGGNVHAPPFDVMEAGRMAVIQDPQGAFFMVWEPGETFGVELVNEPGALVWNELNTSDTAGAKDFYGQLFGWNIEQFPGSPQEYLAVKVGEANNGGIQALQMPGVPPHWLAYFGVEDIDAGIAKVEELGGKKVVGPIDIQIAKIAVVQDPQGAVFALYAGQVEP